MRINRRSLANAGHIYTSICHFIRKKRFRNVSRLLAMLLAVVVVMAGATFASADDPAKFYSNPDSGYGAYFVDEAELVDSSQDVETLKETMKDITQYANVIFWTIPEGGNPRTVESAAEDKLHELVGKTSAVIFVIDMDNRKVCVYSDGAAYDVITKSMADTITDNVYTYASKRDYFGCANEGFKQCFRLLDGQKIAQPMKLISNILLAAMAALIFNYLVMRILSRPRSATDMEVLAAINVEQHATRVTSRLVNQTRVYSPPQSSSSGGGGGHGGGGGGGHSGGGGSHSF